MEESRGCQMNSIVEQSEIQVCITIHHNITNIGTRNTKLSLGIIVQRLTLSLADLPSYIESGNV